MFMYLDFIKKGTREMNTVELASRILTQLGFYQEPSKELGVDDRRDNIVHLIEEYTHPVKELTLSIGEIHAVWAASNYYELDKNGQVDVIKFTEFAYAILKKAQEK